MTDNLAFININERAYKYIRQFSIKSVEDALTELITNSADAYRQTSFSTKRIDIEIRNPNILIVRDYALGLDTQGLQTCFLQAGNYTASDTSRGFFSRGAKDISAIGDVYFTGIKNNKMSQCLLNTDAYGAILTDNVDATEEIRSIYGILDDASGMHIKLNLLPNFSNMNSTTIFNNLQKIATLRDIFADKTNAINLKEYDNNNNIIFQKNVTYEYPEGTTILDMQYVVPNYPQFTANFVINQTQNIIPQPTKEQQMEFGFLIKDATSVYEVNTINTRFRWNPYINYLYGHLYCDGIHSLLLDYDKNGPSISNPYPIIDPARISGINMQHPFIIQLYSIPLVRLDYILRQLNVSKSANSVSIDELNDLLDELNQFGLQMLDANNIAIQWTNNYDAHLVKAINDDRMNYVSYEKSYSMGDEYDTKEIDAQNNLFDQILKQNPSKNSNLLYVVDVDKNVIQIPNLVYSDIHENDDPARIMQTIPHDIATVLKTQPYIYRISTSGKLEKIYIFDKGTTDFSSRETNLNVKNKNFSITFINDLNIQERYKIDTSSGINIQINLNNNLAKKYLSSATSLLDHTTSAINVSSVTSVNALLFLKELLIDAISNIITDSDATNQKLILDSDNSNNVRKVIDYKNKLVAQIESSLDIIFEKYISDITNANFVNISDIITQLTDSMTQNSPMSEEMIMMTKNLIATVQTSLAK